MSMLGLRDFVVVAPASSFQQHAAENVFSDHHHHHHHHHHISGNSATALGIGVGVFPLLTAAPCVMEGRGHGGGGVVGGEEEEEEGVMGTVSCTDCGNKAKRDCKFRRCRTCCKTRGYQCHTHVKSTWVPAARRRERQLMMGGTCTTGGEGGGGGGTSTESSSGEAKRARVVVAGSHNSHNNTAAAAALSHNSASKSFDTSSTQQDGGMKEREQIVLPGQVKARGVFRCVRVTAMEEGGEDEYAYQAMVKIGGHVFKGFLYDQGSEQKNIISSSELHLHTDPHHPHQRDFSSSSPLPTHPTPFHPTSHPGMLVFGGAG